MILTDRDNVEDAIEKLFGSDLVASISVRSGIEEMGKAHPQGQPGILHLLDQLTIYGSNFSVFQSLLARRSLSALVAVACAAQCSRGITKEQLLSAIRTESPLDFPQIKASLESSGNAELQTLAKHL